MFFNNYLYELGFGDKLIVINDSLLEEYVLFFFFGCINYVWKDCYLLEVNLCYDGLLCFVDGYCWGFFLLVFVGWRIFEEDFWKNVVVLVVVDNLKLCVFYGVFGN